MRVIQIGEAFGVRMLGAALVVISDSTYFRDKRHRAIVSDHCRSVEVDYQSGTKLPHSKGFADPICAHFQMISDK